MGGKVNVWRQYFGNIHERTFDMTLRVEEGFREGLLLSWDFNKWAEILWVGQDARPFKAQGTMCKGRVVSKSLTFSVTKEAIQIMGSNSATATVFSHYQVSLHRLGCDLCNEEVCSMSAVKIGSIFIIRSVMLPLRPDHVSLETPSYIKQLWPVIGKKTRHLWESIQ